MIKYFTIEDLLKHYLQKKFHILDYNNRAEYEYAQRKHEFFIEDLKRYNIRALLIDEYIGIC